VPNNSYIRGVRRERELVNEYRKRGWDACRSAGSHSPWDVWAFDPRTGDVELTQIKSKKGAKKMTDRVLNVFHPLVVTRWRTFS